MAQTGAVTSLPGDLRVPGNINRGGSITPAITRAELAQQTLAKYIIPWTFWRVWDAYGTNLPGTSAADDLGLIGGTFGTNSPSIQTYDVKAAGPQTLYARAAIWLPPEYDAGETINLRFRAGMLTTAADNTATIDAELYKSDGEAGIGSDLITTAAQDINNTTLADKDFVVTASALSPGDVLDLRVTLAINDAATATEVQRHHRRSGRAYGYRKG